MNVILENQHKLNRIASIQFIKVAFYFDFATGFFYTIVVMFNSKHITCVDIFDNIYHEPNPVCI